MSEHKNGHKSEYKNEYESEYKNITGILIKSSNNQYFNRISSK